VGALADKILQSKRFVLMNRARADLIEGHVCRRLQIDPNDQRVEHFVVDRGTIAGGRRSIEIVELRRVATDPPLAMYGIKRPHGAEPESCVLASQLSIGPFVLDVSNDGVILEVYFPPDVNIRERRPIAGEYEYYGKRMGTLFLRLILVGANLLLLHRDERLDHIFVLGGGKTIDIRLIGWGWAAIWPIERFDEWAVEQFRWMYLQLSFQEPAIWKAFLSTLMKDLPEKIAPQALSYAYLAFAKQQAPSLGAGVRGDLAQRFLEFIVESGPVHLDVEPLNRFAEQGRDVARRDLAGLWDRVVR